MTASLESGLKIDSNGRMKRVMMTWLPSITSTTVVVHCICSLSGAAGND